MDSMLRNTIRAMAWQRAKGELKSILETYYSGAYPEDNEKFVKFDHLLEEFIKKVEEHGCSE